MTANGPILVIDDDLDIREALCDALEQEGYVAAAAPDGDSALTYLSDNPPPSLVLLDWNMAPMNGAEFMRAMTERYGSNIPVLLLSADARVIDREASARGFAAYFKKAHPARCAVRRRGKAQPLAGEHGEATP